MLVVLLLHGQADAARHYAVSSVHASISLALDKLVQRRQLPTCSAARPHYLKLHIVALADLESFDCIELTVRLVKSKTYLQQPLIILLEACETYSYCCSHLAHMCFTNIS